MRLLYSLTAAATFLLTGSSRAEPTVPVLAVTEQNESLSVKWNGEDLDGAIITRLDGRQEAWHVTLPPEYLLFPGDYTLPEPAGEEGINRLVVDELSFVSFDLQVVPVGSNGFTWTSDVAGETGNANPLWIQQAGQLGGGIFPTSVVNLVQLFDLVLEDKADAPDGGSTFTLAGLALAGVGMLRRRWTE